MARRFTDDRLVIASHNQGKIREIADLVAPFGVTVVSARELGLLRRTLLYRMERLNISPADL